MAKKPTENQCACGQAFDDKHWQVNDQCAKCSGIGYKCPRCETEMGLPVASNRCPACKASCLLEKL